MDAVNQQAERLRFAANEYADNARELAREHLEEQTTTENLKHFIGEKLESLKESILHGDHEAHEIYTGHGLMEPDENKPESFKQYVGEKIEGLKESILHGNHEAHEIHTGHGLMELDDNTPETVLEADGGGAQ
jgi:hypothetical protein